MLIAAWKRENREEKRYKKVTVIVLFCYFFVSLLVDKTEILRTAQQKKGEINIQQEGRTIKAIESKAARWVEVEVEASRTPVSTVYYDNGDCAALAARI